MPTQPFPAPQDAKTSWVKPISFAECQEKYREFFVLEKRDGVVLCRLHTQGGPLRFGLHWHHAQPMFFKDIGQDPSNELLIFTGTGNEFIGGLEPGSFANFDLQTHGVDHFWTDGTELVESFLYNIRIPTIAAFNGPGIHTEWALMSDLVICASSATFGDSHYLSNMVAGDGLALVLMKRMGVSRGAYAAHLGTIINAKDALAYGLVQEVVPDDKLIGRAWELADFMMQRPRSVRRMQHEAMIHIWKDFMHRHFGYALGREAIAMHVDNPMA